MLCVRAECERIMMPTQLPGAFESSVICTIKPKLASYEYTFCQHWLEYQGRDWYTKTSYFLGTYEDKWYQTTSYIHKGSLSAKLTRTRVIDKAFKQNDMTRLPAMATVTHKQSSSSAPPSQKESRQSENTRRKSSSSSLSTLDATKLSASYLKESAKSLTYSTLGSLQARTLRY